MEIKARIVEVLAKYNRHLEDAPLDMLTMAMERMIENRLTVSPLPEEIAKLLALREGLPSTEWTPWQVSRKGEYLAITPGGSTRVIATVYREEEARAIAALPSLFDALERAYKAPLPEEIAGIVERLYARARQVEDEGFWQGTLVWKAAAALEKMGRENERLETENDKLRNSVEAVRAEYLQRFMDASARADAIKAKTIEEVCARIQETADSIPGVTTEGQLMKDTCLDIMDANRALNQPEA